MSERPDEGMLLAFLDDELSDMQRADVERWVQSDTSVAQELEELAKAARRVQSAVALLGEGQAPISTEIPLALRKRSGAFPGSTREPAPTETKGTGKGAPSVKWGRAAVFVLAAGLAGASALPGSPVPGWLRAGWSALRGGEAVETTSASGAVEDESRTGLAVTPDLGRLTVRIEEVRSGTTLMIILGEETNAAVYATGDPSFATGAGFVDVRGPGDLVEVQVPASVTELDVVVAGVVYVSRRGGELQTPVEPSERSASELVYRIQAQSPN